MAMTAGMLWTCTTLAAIGLIFLIIALRASLQNTRRREPTNRLWLALTVTLAASLLWIDIVILWCLIEYGLLGIDFSTNGLRALMEQAGLWAPLASVGLMAVHSFLPFPAEIIAVANGIVFGPWIGVVVTWLGAMLGATLSYEVARGLGPAARARFVPSRYRTRLDAFSINIGIAPLLVSRMLPIVSFNLINYAAGLAGVPRVTFLWTTGLGILPLTVLSVVLGSQALEWPVYGWIVASVALLVIFAAVHMAKRLRARDHETGRSTAAVRRRSPGQSTR